MQDAFAQEKNAVGTWPEIGYSAPGTADDDKSTYASNVITYSGAEGLGWVAKPKNTALNDCGTDEQWGLLASIHPTNGEVTIADDGTDDDCKILTASWTNLLKNPHN